MLSRRPLSAVVPTALPVAAFVFAASVSGQTPRTEERQVTLEPGGEALRLFRSVLLPGFYDDWALQERSRIELLQEEAIETLSDDGPEPAAAQAEVAAIDPTATIS